ncbi:hypothetical protein SmJEL517_g03761 [Synchytrium microbalum]|uniref:Cilia- and flagella-associated protein 157 n=1 Tax=Synchytrium microbalum TaxID=1806994 RepID=A0A507BVE7_9FUNG|nr:uncharacterized protein SmJEL517_g03761 [Synchytrium microbalum]TPX33380.1 hypothetical protein SmJEL517_g03761 [Synchytrium microbalum]
MSEKKGAKKGEENPAVEIPQELSGELLEAKVRDLNDKLLRYKAKCETLTNEIEVLGKAQGKIIADKQDIVEFLNIKVVEHEKHIGALEQRVRELQNEKKEAVEAARMEAEETAIVTRAEIDHFQMLSAKYKTDLDSLLEFKSRKDELESVLKATQTKLDTREREFKNSVHELERKVLQDKNMMKNEMLHKVNDAVSNFRRVADQQMAETTKRAIRENMVITSQLKKMSSRTIEFIAENESLTAKVQQLKTSNALLSESEQELARKNQANQKVIQLLVEKLKGANYWCLWLAVFSSDISPLQITESDRMLELACDIQTAQKELADQKEENGKAPDSIGEDLFSVVDELLKLFYHDNDGRIDREMIPRLMQIRDALLDCGFGSLASTTSLLATTGVASRQALQQAITASLDHSNVVFKSTESPLGSLLELAHAQEPVKSVEPDIAAPADAAKQSKSPVAVNPASNVVAVPPIPHTTSVVAVPHVDQPKHSRPPMPRKKEQAADFIKNETLLADVRSWGAVAKTQPKRKSSLFVRHT